MFHLRISMSRLIFRMVSVEVGFPVYGQATDEDADDGGKGGSHYVKQ